MKKFMIATVNELESLYASYCLLEDNSVGGDVDYSFGKHIICKRLIEIFRSDCIIPIVLSVCNNSFDDYVYFVRQDTPAYIMAIKERIYND